MARRGAETRPRGGLANRQRHLNPTLSCGSQNLVLYLVNNRTERVGLADAGERKETQSDLTRLAHELRRGRIFLFESAVTH
jgi:hypothetical protein